MMMVVVVGLLLGDDAKNDGKETKKKDYGDTPIGICASEYERLKDLSHSAAYSKDWSEKDTAEKELGTDTIVVEKPGCFFFVRGRYIKPPYKFVKRGRCLFLNDNLLDVDYWWPYPPVQKEPPKVPASINKNTGSFDDAFLCYIHSVEDWATIEIANKFSTESKKEKYEKTVGLIVNELKKCPNVEYARTATNGPWDYFRYKLYSEKKETGSGICAWNRLNKEQEIARLKEKFNKFVTIAMPYREIYSPEDGSMKEVEQYGAYFVPGICDASEKLVRDGTAPNLKMLIDIMESKLDDKTKYDLLMEIDESPGVVYIGKFDSQQAKEFLKNFNAPPEFHAELDKWLEKYQGSIVQFSLEDMLERHKEFVKDGLPWDDQRKYNNWHERWRTETQKLMDKGRGIKRPREPKRSESSDNEEDDEDREIKLPPPDHIYWEDNPQGN